MKLAIALATRGRPELLLDTISRTIENMHNPETRLIVAIDDDDSATLRAMDDFHDDRVSLSVRPRPDSLGEKYNRCFAACPADVGLVMVDYAPQITPGFDNLIIDAAHAYPDGIAFVVNRLANLSFSEINAASYRAIELMGRFYSDDYPFWFIDHGFEDIAKMTGRAVYCDVKIDTSRRPGTQSKRDVAFWAEYFGRIAPEREEQARRIIDEMHAPGHEKAVLVRNFPLIRQRSEILNRMAARENAGLPEVPDDERHRRLRARANRKLMDRGLPPVEMEAPGSAPVMRRHPLSVVIAIPNFSFSVAQEFARSLASTMLGLAVHGIPMSIIDDRGNHFVDFSRNRLSTAFAEDLSNYENLFFLDDDIGWQADDFIRVLSRPEDIVCGAYPIKQDPRLPPKFPIDLAKDGDGKLIFSDDGQLIKLNRVAPAGFLRIKRRVIDAFREEYGTFLDGHPREDGSFRPYIEVFRDGVVNGQQVGEDKVFIDRCDHLGIDVWCDPEVRFAHRGSWLWTGSIAGVFREMAQKDADALKAAVEAEPKEVEKAAG